MQTREDGRSRRENGKEVPDSRAQRTGKRKRDVSRRLATWEKGTAARGAAPP